jgi:hypothetical protein
MSLKHRTAQQYYYLSDQSPQEVIFFTSWDSNQDSMRASMDRSSLLSRALLILFMVGHTPHGACMKGPMTIDLPCRESVEVRLIVMW